MTSCRCVRARARVCHLLNTRNAESRAFALGRIWSGEAGNDELSACIEHELESSGLAAIHHGRMCSALNVDGIPRRLRGPQFTGAMAIFELSAGATLEEVPPFALGVQRGLPVDERLVAPGTEQLRRRRFRAGREPGLPLEHRHKLIPEASCERSWQVDRDTRRSFSSRSSESIAPCPIPSVGTP
jgi:hypothetical protein